MNDMNYPLDLLFLPITQEVSEAMILARFGGTEVEEEYEYEQETPTPVVPFDITQTNITL